MAYRIKSVAALTGLTTSTLRAWERRYGLLTPERTQGGYRVYTEDDVARLTRIKSLLDNGFKVSEAIALLEREAPALAPADASETSLGELRAELVQSLLQMDRPRSSRVIHRLASIPLERRIHEILMPVLREVGNVWACGDADVAQEHFASAFIREKLIGMLDDLDAGPSTGPEVVLAGLPGEQHEIGLLAIAVHLALRGWRITYLGPDLPLADLRSALVRRSPRLLCTAMVQQRTVEQAETELKQLRQIVPAEVTVLVGGSGIPAPVGGQDADRLFVIRDLETAMRSPLVDPNAA